MHIGYIKGKKSIVNGNGQKKQVLSYVLLLIFAGNAELYLLLLKFISL